MTQYHRLEARSEISKAEVCAEPDMQLVFALHWSLIEWRPKLDQRQKMKVHENLWADWHENDYHNFSYDKRFEGRARPNEMGEV